MPGVNWETFWAVEFWALVTMASAVATAIATTTALLVRRRSRPEADWAFETRVHSVYEPEFSKGHRYVGWGELSGILHNAGDGTAFRVTIASRDCDSWLKRPGAGHVPFEKIDAAPVLQPGDSCWFTIMCKLEDWDDASVTIEWTREPTRLRKRLKVQSPVKEIGAKPEPRGQ
jgi:hypothetical protein